MMNLKLDHDCGGTPLVVLITRLLLGHNHALYGFPFVHEPLDRDTLDELLQLTCYGVTRVVVCGAGAHLRDVLFDLCALNPTLNVTMCNTLPRAPPSPGTALILVNMHVSGSIWHKCPVVTVSGKLM